MLTATFSEHVFGEGEDKLFGYRICDKRIVPLLTGEGYPPEKYNDDLGYTDESKFMNVIQNLNLNGYTIVIHPLVKKDVFPV